MIFHFAHLLCLIVNLLLCFCVWNAVTLCIVSLCIVPCHVLWIISCPIV